MFERVFTVGVANNRGPDVFPLELLLPQGGKFAVEAWISNFGGSNVHLIRGNVSLPQAQGMLERGFNDFLMTLTGGAKSGPALLPDNVNELTVFFEAQNASGQFELVTVRVYGIA